MIDINNARKVFTKYVSNYDMSNPKINLKYNHTLRVASISKSIAESLNLSKDDIALAELIGLLHDIGRFEQVKLYNSFEDLKTVDHGNLGIKILFENNLIRDFIKNDNEDEIIKKAIYSHNKASIEENYTEREELHSKIVRDADKLDILYLSSINDIKYDINDNTISKEVMECILNKTFIDRHIVKTGLDQALLDLALVYDLNFPYSYKVLRKEHYIDTFIDSLNLKEEETKLIFNNLKQFINNDFDKYEEVTHNVR
jgi:putative nucleotidyltransferase with HDIG domain